MRPTGSPKTPGSGRRKGTPNKRTQAIADIIQDSGKDPVLVMIDLLDHGDPTIRLSAAKELCQYVYPKRKAIELTTQGFFRRAVKKLDGTIDIYTNEPEDDGQDED